jgi:hypothetical protein
VDQLPRAALGFAGLSRPYDRSIWALRTWLDSWAGIGRIAAGMAHQGFDLQLTRYDDRGWRATFYTTGMEHSPTSATGTGTGEQKYREQCYLRLRYNVFHYIEWYLRQISGVGAA